MRKAMTMAAGAQMHPTLDIPPAGGLFPAGVRNAQPNSSSTFEQFGSRLQTLLTGTTGAQQAIQLGHDGGDDRSDTVSPLPEALSEVGTKDASGRCTEAASQANSDRMPGVDPSHPSDLVVQVSPEIAEKAKAASSTSRHTERSRRSGTRTKDAKQSSVTPSSGVPQSHGESAGSFPALAAAQMHAPGSKYNIGGMTTSESRAASGMEATSARPEAGPASFIAERMSQIKLVSRESMPVVNAPERVERSSTVGSRIFNQNAETAEGEVDGPAGNLKPADIPFLREDFHANSAEKIAEQSGNKVLSQRGNPASIGAAGAAPHSADQGCPDSVLGTENHATARTPLARDRDVAHSIDSKRNQPTAHNANPSERIAQLTHDVPGGTAGPMQSSQAFHQPPLADAASFRAWASGNVHTAVAPPVSGSQVFAALEANGEPSASWVHAGTRHVEAGYLDPALGWVGVRAEAVGATVHANILPTTPDGAQVLSAHIAALNTYIGEHHSTPVHVSMASPVTEFGVSGNQSHMGGDSGGQTGTPADTHKEDAPPAGLAMRDSQKIVTMNPGAESSPGSRTGAMISLLA